MRIVVTGAAGFLGWHLRCRALAAGIETVPAGRADLADPGRLAELLSKADAIVHCAGVNRDPDADVVRTANPALARTVVEAVERSGSGARIVYANSIQARPENWHGDNPYGAGKREAGEILAAAGTGYSDVVLANLFGEHGRPGYNSFVATFADAVAQGASPTITEDRQVPLVHVQAAAECLLREAGATGVRAAEPAATPLGVSDVLAAFTAFRETYVDAGEIPDRTGPLGRELFNTFRSYLPPVARQVTPRGDDRGMLVETVRSRAGEGQSFVSTTVPGATRGDHFHLRKFERFQVVQGEAVISLRRLFTREVLRFEVSGERPAAVDMPTMWVHRIENRSGAPVTTVFWADELYDPADADTHPRLTLGEEDA